MIVHLFAVAVPVVVAPLGARLRGGREAVGVFVGSGALTAVTFTVHRGALAAAWVVPWLAAASWWAAVELWVWSRERRWWLASLMPLVSAAFLVVSALALFASRAGSPPDGFPSRSWS